MKHKIKRVHFVGIGGAGMSGIAEVLANRGFEVGGSDLAASATTRYTVPVTDTDCFARDIVLASGGSGTAGANDTGVTHTFCAAASAASAETPIRVTRYPVPPSFTAAYSLFVADAGVCGSKT